MKKRRLPSLRRHAPVEEGAVGFEDLPADARGSEVVTHPAPGAPAAGGADDDDTKPRPSMPASAVVLHEAADAGADPRGGPDRGEESDYLFRPPAEFDASGVDTAAMDTEDGAAGPDVPDVVLDEDIRADVLASTGDSTFLEGPPGSGISTLLAERIVTTLRAGVVAADSLTVVTRDRGSAALLRERLRDLFEAAAADAEDDVVRRRMGAAVAHLRGAQVGSGPEIAAAILRRWPEAAALAPGFTVMAPHAARLRFELDFDAWLGGAGGDDPAVERALALGISPGQIHDLAEAVTVHIGLAPATGASAEREPDPAVVFADIAARIEELGQLAGHGDAEDAGVVQIRRLQGWLADTSGLDAHTTIGHFLVNAPTKIRQAGSRAHWEPPETCAAQMEGCRDLAGVWAETRRAFGRSTVSALLDSIAAFTDAARVERARSGGLFPTDVVPAAVSLLTRDAAARRIERDRHRLVVVDDVWDVDAASLGLVLVLTSLDDDVDNPFRLRPGPGRLLAGGAAITSMSRSRGADPRLVTRLRERGTTPLRLRTNFRAAPALVAWTTSAFGALIGDDGDVALAPHPAVPAPQPTPATGFDGDSEDVGIAGGDVEAHEPEGPAVQADDAVESVPVPVPGPTDPGDPNAAVSTNEIPLPEAPPPAATVLTPEGHAVALPEGGEGPAEPTDDQQSSGPESGVVGADEPDEPAAAAAAAVGVPDPDEWGPVVAAWTRADGRDVVDLRNAEACAVAGSLRMLVESDAPCVRLPDGTARPARWSDCAVVLGSAAGLEQYLDALESAGVPYSRVSTGTELLRRQEVADLVNALRAADDPDDALSVVAALRGLAFGCSDTDLVAAAAAAGAPLRPTSEPPEGTPDRVADGLRTLAAWHTRRDLPALELIDGAVEATRLREAARAALGADPTHIDAFRSLVLDWCGDASPLRSVLGAVDAAFRPWTPTAVTAPGPPSGTDVVEVLTVAEVAGREYPVVAVANLHRLRVPLPTAVADHSAGRLHLRAGPPDRGFVTDGFDAALARDDEEYLAQRTRLVCAAFSRARDKLIVAVTAAADDVDPTDDVPRRDLVRRVARLVVEPDPDVDGVVRAVVGVTLVPVGSPEGEIPPSGDPTRAVADEAAGPVDHLAPAPTLADLTGETDPLREAVALALSRVDFASPAPPQADADAQVADLLASVLASDLVGRAQAADRVLRRPTVLLDGGPVGVFADRLDLVLVEGTDAVGVAVTIGPPDDAARTRVALGTHALGQAAGLGVGAALLVDARSATVTVMGPADVAAAVGTALTHH